MITQDTHIDSEGCTFVPIILGSDKTTVSVATGQNEYYPLYLSIGNVHNSVRRAHRGAVTVLAFLANPKGTSKQAIRKKKLTQFMQLIDNTLMTQSTERFAVSSFITACRSSSAV